LEAAVVFDIDGTLVTFQFDVKGTRKALIDELERRGYETSGLDLSTPTQRILDVAKEQSPGRNDAYYKEVRAAVYSILDRFETSSAATTSPFPEAAGVLRKLKAKGLHLAVLTNSGKKAASVALTRSGLGGFFEFVLTRDDTSTMKPRPEGLAMAVERLSLPREAVSYVGDSPYDIQAAKGAGVRSIAVATGNYTEERLWAEGADAVITSISGLPDVLGV
jgi:phosphoglycolate phosphatase